MTLPLPPNGGYEHLQVVTLEPAARLIRITRAHRPSALHFGAGTFRWDAPVAEYSVLYVADSIDAAFAETINHGVAATRLPASYKVLEEMELHGYRVWEIRPRQTLQLASFYGHGLARLSLDGEICTCTDYSVPRAWSKWSFDHPSTLAGIVYHPRHYPAGTSYALFDRCRHMLEEVDLGVLAQWREGPRDIYDVLEAFGWGLK